MPSFILGAVKGSDMTTFLPLAIYASVQKRLGRALRFPGGWAAWEKMLPMSTGKLNSWFHEWVVLQPETAGERFNIVDSSDFSWGRAWPVVAGDRLRSTTRIASIRGAGGNEIMTTVQEVTDDADGSPVATLTSTVVIRGEG